MTTQDLRDVPWDDRPGLPPKEESYQKKGRETRGAKPRWAPFILNVLTDIASEEQQARIERGEPPGRLEVKISSRRIMELVGGRRKSDVQNVMRQLEHHGYIIREYTMNDETGQEPHTIVIVRD